MSLCPCLNRSAVAPSNPHAEPVPCHERPEVVLGVFGGVVGFVGGYFASGVLAGMIASGGGFVLGALTACCCFPRR